MAFHIVGMTEFGRYYLKKEKTIQWGSLCDPGFIGS